jgi:hypothetical protein
MCGWVNVRMCEYVQTDPMLMLWSPPSTRVASERRYDANTASDSILLPAPSDSRLRTPSVGYFGGYLSHYRRQ